MKTIALEFVKANPSGNTTVFVLTPCPREKYGEIARAVMEDTVLCAQQVGFLETPQSPFASARMQMMGGEFCGNASRSFAAWLAMGGWKFLAGRGLRILPLGEAVRQVEIEVSGHQGILAAVVEDIGHPFGCSAQVEMPGPRFVRRGEREPFGPYSLVGMEGITHMVLWEKAGDETLFDWARELLASEEVDTSCFGVLFLDGSGGRSMTPLVYVQATDSLVWEGSCGSGSLAVAAALADRTGRSCDRLRVAQPGGELTVSVDLDGAGGFAGARLAGDVFFTALGTAHIQL